MNGLPLQLINRARFEIIPGTVRVTSQPKYFQPHRFEIIREQRFLPRPNPSTSPDSPLVDLFHDLYKFREHLVGVCENCDIQLAEPNKTDKRWEEFENSFQPIRGELNVTEIQCRNGELDHDHSNDISTNDPQSDTKLYPYEELDIELQNYEEGDFNVDNRDGEVFDNKTPPDSFDDGGFYEQNLSSASAESSDGQEHSELSNRDSVQENIQIKAESQPAITNDIVANDIIKNGLKISLRRQTVTESKSVRNIQYTSAEGVIGVDREGAELTEDDLPLVGQFRRRLHTAPVGDLATWTKRRRAGSVAGNGSGGRDGGECDRGNPIILAVTEQSEEYSLLIAKKPLHLIPQDFDRSYSASGFRTKLNSFMRRNPFAKEEDFPVFLVHNSFVDSLKKDSSQRTVCDMGVDYKHNI